MAVSSSACHPLGTWHNHNNDNLLMIGISEAKARLIVKNIIHRLCFQVSSLCPGRSIFFTMLNITVPLRLRAPKMQFGSIFDSECCLLWICSIQSALIFMRFLTLIHRCLWEIYLVFGLFLFWFSIFLRSPQVSPLVFPEVAQSSFF